MFPADFLSLCEDMGEADLPIHSDTVINYIQGDVAHNIHKYICSKLKSKALAKSFGVKSLFLTLESTDGIGPSNPTGRRFTMGARQR